MPVIYMDEVYWTWCSYEFSYPCGIKWCKKKVWGVTIHYPCGVKSCKGSIPYRCRKVRTVKKWEQSFCWMKCTSYIFYRSCEGCDMSGTRWSWGGAYFGLPGVDLDRAPQGTEFAKVFDLDNQPKKSGKCSCDDPELDPTEPQEPPGDPTLPPVGGRVRPD